MPLRTTITVSELARGLRKALDYVATKKRPLLVTRRGVGLVEIFPVDYHPRRVVASSPSVLPDCALGGCLYDDGRCVRGGQCAAKG